MIEARGLFIEFPIYNLSSRSIKRKIINSAIGGMLKTVKDNIVIKALDNLNFCFSSGDRIGLYGHNGSGKSTFLRAISNIYEPSRGSLVVKGKVLSLLDLFLGFDFELTGYENIYSRGLLLGLSKSDINSKINEIADFTELGSYLNMPVRTYSSGMSMRLAFAISTCVDCDILLMDEWLSVGDKSFMQKAESRIKQLADKAAIIVLASHDINLLKSVCNKILYMEHGRIVEEEIIER